MSGDGRLMANESRSLYTRHHTFHVRRHSLLYPLLYGVTTSGNVTVVYILRIFAMLSDFQAMIMSKLLK